MTHALSAAAEPGAPAGTPTALVLTGSGGKARPVRGLLVRWFVYPMLLVTGIVGAVMLPLWLSRDPRTNEDLLDLVRTTSGRQRWLAAHELSVRLAAGPDEPSDSALGRNLLILFEDTRRKDPGVASFLAAALGRLQPPGSGDALAGALDAAGADLRIQILRALGQIPGTPFAPGIEPLLHDADPGVRKAAAYAAGRLGGASQASLLVPLLGDEAIDVRWNAATALATLGSAEGSVVLRQMLDRAYLGEVSETLARRGREPMSASQVEDVMINALRAVARLRSPSFHPLLDDLRRNDRSPRVQDAARVVLESLSRSPLPDEAP